MLLVLDNLDYDDFWCHGDLKEGHEDVPEGYELPDKN
jgi:hypothetical protein